MAAVDYIEANHDLYFGDKIGKNFKQVLECEATWTSTTTRMR